MQKGKKFISDFPEHAIHLHMHENYKSVELCIASFASPTVQTFSRLTSPEVETSGEQETMTYGVWRRQTGKAAPTRAGLKQRIS